MQRTELSVHEEDERGTMTQINKLKIGLALNAIGLMLDDESYERIKGRLTEIEDIVKAEPDTDDPEDGQQWTPIKIRPMTKQEKEYYSDHVELDLLEEGNIADCPLPEEGQEVLITIYGGITIDTFIHDELGCGFEDHDIEDVVAWAPLPEPYEKEGDENDQK